MRNGKADEWAEKYDDRIQQHLDAEEKSFSINADNQSFPPSISGIQNGIIAYAMNLMEWGVNGCHISLAAMAKATVTSSFSWTPFFNYLASYEIKPQTIDISKATIKVINVTYTGDPLEPKINVMFDNTVLDAGSYSIKYTDNITPGIAAVSITGTDPYKGTATTHFEITPADDTTKYAYDLYSNVLGRRADSEGFALWVQKLKNGLPRNQAAACFFNSEEFRMQRHENSEIIDIAYRSLLNRSPDKEGKDAWKRRLDNGLSLFDFIMAFTAAEEYQLISKMDNSKQYINNLYEKCLGRKADIEELEVWHRKINNGMSFGEVTVAFFSSSEFASRDLSPENAITATYLAILNRQPDKKGYREWLNNLNSGMSISEIAFRFTKSKEFYNLCRGKT